MILSFVLPGHIMIGSLIGGAVGAIGSIFGGVKASKAMKKVKANVESQKQANEDWMNRRYNEDVTRRVGPLRVLTKTREMMLERNRAAAGAQAVMGGTEESVAAAKAAGNEAMAEAASQIAAAGDRRKDAIEQQYRQRDAELDGQLNNIEAGKAQAISQAVQGVAGAGANLAGLF